MPTIEARDAIPGTQYTTRGMEIVTAGDLIEDAGKYYRRVVSTQGVASDLPLDYQLHTLPRTERVAGLVGLPEAELVPQIAELSEEERDALMDEDGRTFVLDAVAALRSSDDSPPVASPEPEPEAAPNAAQPAGEPPSRPALQLVSPPAEPPPAAEPSAAVVKLPAPKRPTPPAVQTALPPTARSGVGRCPECNTDQTTKPQMRNEQQLIMAAHQGPTGTFCLGSGRPAVDPKLEAAADARAARQATEAAEAAEAEESPWAALEATTAAARIARVKSAASVAEVKRLEQAPADPPLQAAVSRECTRQAKALERVLQVLTSGSREDKIAELERVQAQDRTKGRPGMVTLIERLLADLRSTAAQVGDDVAAALTEAPALEGLEVSTNNMGTVTVTRPTSETAPTVVEPRAEAATEEPSAEPCTACGEPTQRLEHGQLTSYPLCPACRASAEAESVTSAAPAPPAPPAMEEPDWDRAALPWPQRVATSSVACALELIEEQEEQEPLREAAKLLRRMDGSERVQTAVSLRLTELEIKADEQLEQRAQDERQRMAEEDRSAPLAQMFPGEHPPEAVSPQAAVAATEAAGELAALNGRAPIPLRGEILQGCSKSDWHRGYDSARERVQQQRERELAEVKAREAVQHASARARLSDWLSAWPDMACKAKALGLRMSLSLDSEA